MVTKRKSIDETKRPWRQAGAELRNWLACPLCSSMLLRVVAYRRTTARLECESCGLRFTMSPIDVANTLRLRPDEVLAGWEKEALRGTMGGTTIAFVEATAVIAWRERFVNATDEIKATIRRRVLQDAGTTIAEGVLAKAGDTPEERANRLSQLRPDQPEA